MARHGILLFSPVYSVVQLHDVICYDRISYKMMAMRCGIVTQHVAREQALLQFDMTCHHKRTVTETGFDFVAGAQHDRLQPHNGDRYYYYYYYYYHYF